MHQHWCWRSPATHIRPYGLKRRKTWHGSVEQMQTDLDSYLQHYNTQRPHQGRMMEGQTPYSMFKKGLKLIPKCMEMVFT